MGEKRVAMKKAIVTLAIGDEYLNMFHKYCYDSWNAYCDEYDYDLVLIKHPLDDSLRASKRSASWQKLLILSQEWSSEYDRVVWVDSDVIMNPCYAYDISDGVPMDRVGAVDAYSIPSKEINKEESVVEGLYHIGYNKGRGQGTGVFKDSYSSYKDAKKAVEKLEKERGGSYNMVAYYVSDKAGNFVMNENRWVALKKEDAPHT